MGQLRQNPTQMIHDVRMGQEYVLTDRGVPTARIVPFKRGPWVKAVDLSEEFRALPPDPELWQEIYGARQSEPDDDPWELR